MPPQYNYSYYPLLETVIEEDEMSEEEVVLYRRTPPNPEHTESLRNVRMPPITILKAPVDYIHNLLRNNNVSYSHYNIKHQSIGLRLYTKSSSDYERICKIFNENGIEYFSYRKFGERPFKVVLSNFMDMDCCALKTLLISLGLQCLDVKKVYKPTKYKIAIIYIVWLKKSSINLNELKQRYSAIKTILVRWDLQRPRIPTTLQQCYNCQMFGHGATHCHVSTYCSYCAGNHYSYVCPNPQIIRCANCYGNHRSVDLQCPSRSSYIEIKNRYINRQTKQYNNISNNNNGEASTSPTVINQSINTSCYTNRPINSYENPSSNQVLFYIQAEPASLYLTNNINSDFSRSYAEVVQSARSVRYTFDEFAALIPDMLTQLGDCNNKADQFDSLARLCLKYVYDIGNY